MSTCVFIFEDKVKLIDVWNNFNINIRVYFYVLKVFFKKIKILFYFLLQINMFLIFLYPFDMLMLKIIFFLK